MRTLTILITGAGAAGTKGTIYSLKNNFEDRPVRIIGVDINKESYGKYLVDKFYQIPRPLTSTTIVAMGQHQKAPSWEFNNKLVAICEEEGVDVILPQVEAEILPFAYFKNYLPPVAVSDIDSIIKSSEKSNLIEIANNLGIATPETYRATKWEGLENAMNKVGFPCIVKPSKASGMRGFRVITDKPLSVEAFQSKKPSDCPITKEELHKILGNDFPKMVIQEYLSGDEYTIDVLSDKGKVVQTIPRKRVMMRTGITFIGEVVKDNDLRLDCTNLSNQLGMQYAHGFQFKADSEGTLKLLECNPRIQGTMVMATLAGANIIYASAKYALNEEVPFHTLSSIDWGMKFYRNWGGFSVIEESMVSI